MEDPKIRYFIKSVRINRPISFTRRNIMDLNTLRNLVQLYDHSYMDIVYKAVFLTAFYGFLRVSNLAPHFRLTFDFSRHITAGDVIFAKIFVKIIIKWSKTNQNRNNVHVFSIPKLKDSNLCPHRALSAIFKLYSPQPHDPVFQIKTPGWQLLIDSHIGKFVSRMNKKWATKQIVFTFRCSGATLAYNSHVPLQQIKSYGSWAADCVWRYIQQDQSMGETIASSLACAVDNV